MAFEHHRAQEETDEKVHSCFFVEFHVIVCYLFVCLLSLNYITGGKQVGQQSMWSNVFGGKGYSNCGTPDFSLLPV